MSTSLTRRSFLALSSMVPLTLLTRASASASKIPVGLELYSVREELKRDPQGTVRAVAKMGYQCVEFYAPYLDWSEDDTKNMRKLLDDLGMGCPSTHNGADQLKPNNLSKVRDRNLMLGSRYVVQASSPEQTSLDGWKQVADALNLGRIRSLHLKDWSPDADKEYRVLFGEGVANWREIFAVAESVGGVEYYLIEQEGSRFSELETAQKCLQSYRAMGT
jgi:sugar phosphate isomerase/epimerase